MTSPKIYKLYAVVFTLGGTTDKEVAYATSFHPTTKASLKRQLTLKLRSRYPECALHGGDKYFNILEEQILESVDGWNRYSILPKEEEVK